MSAQAETDHSIRGWFAFLLAGGSRGQKIGRAVLALVAAAGIVYVASGPKPWESGIEGRKDPEKKLKTSECVVSGLWWGALADAALAAGLFLSAPWWQRQRLAVPPPALVEGQEQDERRRCQLFWLGVAVTVVWAGFQNYPRLGQSLWGDEEYTMKRHVLGFYQRADDGEMRFRAMPWEETVFGYKRGPNNHNLFSILARLSHGSQPRTGGDWYFSVAAFRFPAFLAGLGGLVTLALFARRLCGPAVGVLAPLLLSLHPWYLRYAVEGRGYAFVFLLLPAMLLFLINALSGGRWRWWLLYGGAQFLTFYAYPGILYTLVAQNLAVAALLIWRHRAGIRQLIPEATRWIIANLVSLMLVLPIYGPCVPQLLAYLKRSRVQGDIGGEWLLNEWGYLSTGMPWRAWAPDNPICHAVSDYASTSPLLFWSIVAAVPVVLLVGLLALCRRGTLHVVIASIVIAAPLLMYLHNSLNGSYLYHWYLVFVLPLLCLVAACGIRGLARLISGRPQVLAVTAVVSIAWFAMVTAPQRNALRNHAIEPLAESVLAMRGAASDPRSPDYDATLTFQFHMYTEAYDSGAFEASSVEAVRALAARADAEGKPLFVNYAQKPLARVIHPELVALLDDPAVFEPVGTFFGLEPQCTRHVLKYRSGTLLAEGVPSPIEDFTGGRTKLVWAQQQDPAKIDAHAVGKKHLLYALDTGDGRPPRAILPEIGNYGKPMLTPDGERIVFTRKGRIKTDAGQTFEPSIAVVSFDGSGLRSLRSGYAQDLWRDPATGIVWVYAGEEFVSVAATAPTCKRLIRFQLDAPDNQELVWDKTSLAMETIEVSADGRYLVGLFPWPEAAIADLETGSLTPLSEGCWTAMSPDDNRNAWVFDANHKDIHVFGANAQKIASVAINSAPEMRGYETYHPRWSNRPEFIVVTGPYNTDKPKSGAEIEIYIGKLAPGLDAVSDWLKVTENALADLYPDVWIDPSSG